ncbi:MAG: DoxX family protein [Cyanobacteria bacterium]|nr:DoxX family protein [Cyanobacteriota bacterium]
MIPSFRESPFLNRLFLEALFAKVPRQVRVEHALFLLRLGMGAYFLYVGNQKLENPQFPLILNSQLEGWAANNPFFWYKDFLTYCVIPLSSFLAYIIPSLEMFIGVSLILGLVVQISLPIAIFLNFNYLMATQHTNPAALGINLAFGLIALALYWSQCGLFWGLDQFILPLRSQSSWSGRASKSGKPKTQKTKGFKERSKGFSPKVNNPVPKLGKFKAPTTNKARNLTVISGKKSSNNVTNTGSSKIDRSYFDDDDEED